MSSEIKKLRNLVSEEVWDLFKEFDVFIAGGAITSIFTNKDVNDLDIYFKTPEQMIAFIRSIYKVDKTDNDNVDNLLGELLVDCNTYVLKFNNITDKSLLGIDYTTNQYVQLITYKTFKTAQEIFDDFDFTCCMGAYSPKDNKFYLHDDFMKHNAQKYLQINVNTLYPLITVLRVNKYVSRGYTVSKAQLLRILLRVSQMNINTWVELKEHIGGMYGLNMDEVFDEKSDFNLESAMNTLDKLESDKKFEIMHARDILYCEIEEKLKHIIELLPLPKDDRISVAGRYFKNVITNSSGELVSGYEPSFKYNLSTWINGGENGIYVYAGKGVVNGIYSGDAESGVRILEIIPAPNATVLELHDTSTPRKLRIIGDCFVSPTEYTREEFNKLFKN